MTYETIIILVAIFTIVTLLLAWTEMYILRLWRDHYKDMAKMWEDAYEIEYRRFMDYLNTIIQENRR